MRRSEQFTLGWDQTNLDAQRIHLLKTKNGADRSIPLNSVALTALEPQREISGNAERVFVTEDGKAFIRKAIRRRFASQVGPGVDGAQDHPHDGSVRPPLTPSPSECCRDDCRAEQPPNGPRYAEKTYIHQNSHQH
jgi:site-specific recombinase XerC